LSPAATIRAYETIYFPAQKIHFARDNPRETAHSIIDNDSEAREAFDLVLDLNRGSLSERPACLESDRVDGSVPVPPAVSFASHQRLIT